MPSLEPTVQPHSCVVLLKKEEAMKRLPGVIFSAVLLALGSLFQILMAVMMVFAGVVTKTQTHSTAGLSTTPTPPTPAWMPLFMDGIGVFFVLLAVWGILT